MAVFERILLTGGAGFVGSYLAPLLAADYPRARRALLTLNDTPAPVDAAWTPIAGDLLDAGAIDEIVASLRPDLVVHLAGQASIGRALDAAEQTWRANFFGSFNLASALARHAPETLALFASSVSVYGASLNDGVAAEDAPPRPLDAYGRSKIAAEGALADVLGPRSRLVIARPVNHSGPRQSEKSFVLSSFAAQIAAIEAGRKQPELRVGDLSKARDFLDVRDVVAAYRALIAKAPELPDRVSVFNIASGQPHTIGDLLDRLRARATRPFETHVDPALLRPSAVDIPTIACDATKLRETTGWRQRHTIDDMLQSLLDYWRGVESAADDRESAGAGRSEGRADQAARISARLPARGIVATGPRTRPNRLFRRLACVQAVAPDRGAAGRRRDRHVAPLCLRRRRRSRLPRPPFRRAPRAHPSRAPRRRACWST